MVADQLLSLSPHLNSWTRICCTKCSILAHLGSAGRVILHRMQDIAPDLCLLRLIFSDILHFVQDISGYWTAMRLYDAFNAT